MSEHNYTPQQALDLLMRRLKERDIGLAAQIQAVVDGGKDVEETDLAGRRKRARSYRKTVPYTHEEALRAALDALRSYFVEQPLLVNSCLDNMASAAVEASSRDRHSWKFTKEKNVPADPESQGKEKPVDVELRTETQISEVSQQEILPLKRVGHGQVEEQKKNLAQLNSMFDFHD